MRFGEAIDLYMEDMRSDGRISSDRTERSYRILLGQHAEDVGNRDPKLVGRDDCKRTLRRWKNPNTAGNRRAILVSFYDWAMQEGYRETNPARQTRAPRRRRANVYRLTRAEAAAMLDIADTVRERRAIGLMLGYGLRNQEARGVQGRHFERAGVCWVSGDIAKGGKERWVPTLPEIEAVATEIALNVAPDEYVLPAQRWRNPPANTIREDLRRRPCSSQALRTIVMDVAARAGIAAHVHPHLLRHAFAEHVARHAGLRVAQELMGHADVNTTRGYTDRPSLDELIEGVAGARYGLSLEPHPAIPREATTGIEPVASARRLPEPNPGGRDGPHTDHRPAG